MELKPKGKTARREPGPYTVEVTFSDGSSMKVCEDACDEVAVDKYNEYYNGIGARVGTTKHVRIFTSEGEVASWTYAGGEHFNKI
jgi:hypothetical protein